MQTKIKNETESLIIYIIYGLADYGATNQWAVADASDAEEGEEEGGEEVVIISPNGKTLESRRATGSDLYLTTMDLKSLKRTLTMGVNLELLCQHVGTGCLFFLSEALSEHL